MNLRWNTYTGRLVLSMAAFIVVPLLFGGLARWLGGRGHFLDGFTPGVYLVTGLVLIWYTVETWRLRVVAQQQAEAAVTPLLLTRLQERTLDEQRLAVRNIGHGAA